jgi:hypothetical protein
VWVQEIKNSGHREVELGDRAPPAASELDSAWKRPCTFTSSSLKEQKKKLAGE